MKVPLLSLVATDTEDLGDGERDGMRIIMFLCFYLVLQTKLSISVFKKTSIYSFFSIVFSFSLLVFVLHLLVDEDVCLSLQNVTRHPTRQSCPSRCSAN